MSDTKNRAASGKRRAARVIKVAPVALAIRAALAVSATTLALSASGTVHAGTRAPQVRTATHYNTSVGHAHAAQPVIDLTAVRGELPSSVNQRIAGADLQAGIQNTDGAFDARTFGAPGAESLGSVQDLVVVSTLTPGPGGVSGPDDSVGLDTVGGFATIGNYSATSATHVADAIFSSGSTIAIGTSDRLAIRFIAVSPLS